LCSGSTLCSAGGWVALLSAAGRRPPDEDPDAYLTAVSMAVDDFKEQQRLIWKLDHPSPRITHTQLQV
jgi:hypothetical protein